MVVSLLNWHSKYLTVGLVVVSFTGKVTSLDANNIVILSGVCAWSSSLGPCYCLWTSSYKVCVHIWPLTTNLWCEHFMISYGFSISLAVNRRHGCGPSKEMHHQLQAKKTKVMLCIFAVDIAAKALYKHAVNYRAL